MAAKCLIVGRAPSDAQEMFGYNPVVEVDWHNPTQQLEQILREPEAHLALVERNFAAVSAHHQTRNFVASVNRLIDTRTSGRSRQGAAE
jgi:hypothetical protein